MGAWLGGGGGMSRRSMRSPDEFGAYVQRELFTLSHNEVRVYEWE